MARLPQPGGDEGQWGDILNDYLSTAHNADGTLKNSSINTSNIISGAVKTASLGNGSVTAPKLSTASAPSAGQALTYDGAGLAWTTVGEGGEPVPDASAGTKGLIQLSGDLGGTAASPTVVGLSGKANTSDVVSLASNQTITGNKNFTGGLQSAGSVVVTTNDSRLTNERTPTNGSVTAAKIPDNTITEVKLAVANAPTTGHILSYNGTQLNWVAAPSGTGDPTLGGDLSGVASNAQIVAGAVGQTELASNAVINAKIADNTITEAKLAITNSPGNNQVLSWNGSGFAWVTPASGGSGSGWTAVSVNSNYTASAGEFVVVDTTNSGVQIQLPAPTNGAAISIKKLTNNVNSVLALAPGGQQISAGPDTSVSVTCNNFGQVIDLLADGTQWHQVG